jgi:hypothetical protein
MDTMEIASPVNIPPSTPTIITTKNTNKRMVDILDLA